VVAFAESSAESIAIPIGSALAVLVIAAIGAIARWLSGKSTFLKTVSDKLGQVYSQEELDKVIEGSLKDKMAPALADVIGDIVSSILKTNFNGDSLPVTSFVKAVINQLKGYSPNVLSKIFSGVLQEVFYSVQKKDAFLSALTSSRPFVDAVHKAVHQVGA
jgi:hypothetical protein